MSPDLNITPAKNFVVYDVKVQRQITLTSLELFCIQKLSHKLARDALAKSRRTMHMEEIRAIVNKVKGEPKE